MLRASSRGRSSRRGLRRVVRLDIFLHVPATAPRFLVAAAATAAHHRSCADVPTMYESAEKVRRDVEDTMARRNLQFYMFEKSDVAEHGEFLGVIGLMRCRW